MEFDITNPIMMQAASNIPHYKGLTFRASEDSVIHYTASSVTSAEYSVDLQQWQNANGVDILLQKGKSVFFRGSVNGTQSDTDFANFTMTGKIYASGSIESMGEMKVGCYTGLFKGCSALATAPELPSTVLSEACYKNMFNGCSNLLFAPKLPATKTAKYCYAGMFYACKKIVSAPRLPAVELSDYCYQNMFNGCSNLTEAPRLPAVTLKANCYKQMFAGCVMLENAPELPATTLVQYCYENMFYGCAKISAIKCMSLTELGDGYTSGWVNGVATVGTFTKNANATWSDTFGSNAIPTGWAVESATE